MLSGFQKCPKSTYRLLEKVKWISTKFIENALFQMVVKRINAPYKLYLHNFPLKSLGKKCVFSIESLITLNIFKIGVSVFG